MSPSCDPSFILTTVGLSVILLVILNTQDFFSPKSKNSWSTFLEKKIIPRLKIQWVSFCVCSFMALLFFYVLFFLKEAFYAPNSGHNYIKWFVFFR